MQALQSDLQHAKNVRAALEELLAWEPTEREVLIFLNALLRWHASEGARLATWRELQGLRLQLVDLQDGVADAGYDELGDGRCVPIDREAAIQRLECELDEALNSASQIPLASAA
jgi:hypothetical protein